MATKRMETPQPACNAQPTKLLGCEEPTCQYQAELYTCGATCLTGCSDDNASAVVDRLDISVENLLYKIPDQ